MPMARLVSLLLAVCFPFLLEAAPIAESLVRIEATSQEPDYKTPWSPGEVVSGVGAGFVIGGDRIMTNAHVVSNARFLAVSKEGDPKPYTARVLHIAHDCDLALLKVDDVEFFNGTTPLEFGGLPEIESFVSVYGYPIGGKRLSVTRGIVSRIDFQTYSHSGMDSHLAIQIDAAINPGNSGGPVMQNGKVVGVAFQGYSGDVAQNVGYMIPVPVIERFMKDVEDGKYDRYIDLAISYQNLFNPAARRVLGLEDKDSGVMVGAVYGGGSSDGILRPGDVLLQIDGYPIASDGSIRLQNGVVPLTEVVERKFRGEKVKLVILRDRKKQTVQVPLDDPWPFTLQSNAYDEKPRYVIYGGLVFQPVDRNFLRDHGPSNQRLNYSFDFFVEDGIYRDHDELVVLSNILPDPINSCANDFRYSLIKKINGRPIRSLRDVAEAFAKPEDFYVIKTADVGPPIVLERKAVEAARENIRTRYGIVSEQNLEK
jgi:S1-C subfamily serine protease